MRAVWPDTVVEENNLTRNISALRKALGESPGEHRYVVTIPGRGYQFVADLKESSNGSEDVLMARHTRSRIVVEDETIDHESAAFGLPIADFASASRTTEYESLAVRPIGKIRRYKKGAVIILLAVLAASIVMWVPRFIDRMRSGSKAPPALQKLEITTITHTGNAGEAAISPDGKYIAYRLIEAGRQALWLRHLATGSNQQILPPTDAQYYGLTFSCDGSHIYFVRSEKNNPLRSLYRMALLGGVPTNLIADVRHAPGFSPDGSRMVFVRESLGLGESALMISNADGSGEQKLAVRKLSDGLWSAPPAWSPDGKSIACTVGSAEVGGINIALVEVRVEDGIERTITAQKWRAIRNIGWLSDGSGLLITARERLGPNIWHISYPDGEARSITNDSTSYVGLSLTADSSGLVTIKSDLQTNIWIVPTGAASTPTGAAHRITFGASNYHRVTWLPDGRLSFASSASSPMDIWVMNADGTGQKQLTAESGANWHQSASPDGRYIVFVSDRSGANNIWRIDTDGANPKQLTSGRGERFPDCSPDGRWVVYTSVSADQNFFTLWKVSIDGGAPVQLTNTHSLWPAVSPDGKWVAYFYRDAQPDSQYKLAVIPFVGGSPVKTFDLPPVALQSPYLVRWTADGRALTYAADLDNISNIWTQPIDGGKPVQLTDFKSDQIFSFDWSRDGKQLVCSRGAWTGDVVLMSNFR